MPARPKCAKELLRGLQASRPGMVRQLERAVAGVKGRLDTGGSGHGIKWSWERRRELSQSLVEPEGDAEEELQVEREVCSG